MTEQPTALRLADALDAGANFYAESSVWYDRELSDAVDAAAAELRRLDKQELANNVWREKTEWVQETAQPQELGRHRADVLRQRIERLHAVNQELLEALRLTSIDCQHLHHAAGDRHSLLEVCPVVVRINAAIARAEGEA